MTHKMFAPNRPFARWIGAAALGVLAISTHVLAQDAAPASEAAPEEQAAATEAGASDLAPFTFTTGQAVGGKSNYQRLCAECHGNNLEGTAAPALSGSNFAHWVDGPAIDLFTFIQEQMPAGAGGTLSDAQVATIMTHLASENGMTASTEALPTDGAELEGFRFGQ